MANYPSMTFDPVLPWEKNSEEASRFIKVLLSSIAVAILITSIVPFLTVEELDRNKQTTIPPRLVKMVLEQKKIVEPPPPPPEPEKEKEPEKEPEKAPEEVKEDEEDEVVDTMEEQEEE